MAQIYELFYICKMKLPETEIKFSAEPECDSYGNFSIECRRDVSYINKMVAQGKLNHGNILGLRVIVMDALAISFRDKCRSIDDNKRELRKVKD